MLEKTRNISKSLAWKIHRNGLGITDAGIQLKCALERKSVNRWTTMNGCRRQFGHDYGGGVNLGSGKKY